MTDKRGPFGGESLEGEKVINEQKYSYFE